MNRLWLAALACTGTCCKKAPPEGGVEVAPSAPEVVQGTGLTGPIDLMGLNEAIAVPRAVLQREQPDAATLEAMLRKDAEAAAAVGVRWVRGHTAVFPNHSYARYRSDRDATLERLDLWVRVTQDAGLEVLLMVSPWSGNHTRDQTDAYVLRDEEGYARYVQALVERYDGDGSDDMPGLARPIRHWEVDNEPDLKNSGSPREDRFDPDGFCTPAQYARVLSLTSAAIRAADPDALVLNGGLYRPMTDTGKTYLDALFALPEVRAAIDVQSQHAYHSERTPRRIDKAIVHARAVAPDLPLWITETNVPSDGKEPWLDRTYQAEQVVLTYGTALARGIERVFWHTLADPPPRSGKPRAQVMDSHSLYVATASGDFERKPAADAYQRIGDFLDGKTWEEVAVSTHEGATLVALGDRWLAWGDGPVGLPVAATRAERARDGAPVGLVAEDGVVSVDLAGGAVFLR